MTIINNDKPKRPDIIGRKEEWATLKRRNMIKQRSANSLSFHCYTNNQDCSQCFSPALLLSLLLILHAAIKSNNICIKMI